MKAIGLGLGGMALAMLVGCASTVPEAAPDPILNPMGVPEVAPEDAESLIPPIVEAERQALANRPFALPETFALGDWERMVVGVNPYRITTASKDATLAQLRLLDDTIRAELAKLKRFDLREYTGDDTGTCTHTAVWRTSLTLEPGAKGALTLNGTVDFRLTNAKTRLGVEELSFAVRTVAKDPKDLTAAIKRVGALVAVRLAQTLAATAPCGGKILACEDAETMTMEGGSLQGIYEGQQMLVYAVVDGVALPLAYADAKPGTTRTNLTLWKFNDAEPLAKAVLDALRDDADNHAKYGLNALAVGDPLPPVWRYKAKQLQGTTP